MQQMIRQRTLGISFLAVAIFLQACTKEEIMVYEIPSNIQPYIDLFEAEAAKRGQDIQIDNLIVEFESDLVGPQGEEAAGLCTFESDNNPTPHIRLDTNSFNWTNNEYHREILVFHELGHCILNRFEHTNTALPNGNRSSIMRGTGEQLYGGDLNLFKREYYLDELFNSNTPPPDWAMNTPEYGSISSANKEPLFLEEFDNNQNGWNLGNSNQNATRIEDGSFFFQSKIQEGAFYTANEVIMDKSRNFEIETSIKIASGDNSVMFQWAGSVVDELSFFGFVPDSAFFLGTRKSGLSISDTVDEFRPDDFNKLTIRRIDGFYYLYVNEAFFDIMEYESFAGNLVSYVVGPMTSMQVDYLRVHYLN
ncbi:MAG: hypothetical protein AAF587_22900 [Bacteroidota bacterium]